ncbi:hypothetical protein SAMN06265375_101551 [Muriicola jejuensis]|uniref:DoxX family protein n=1 Tax=Muriicola jejuensis TaxID=504488 RepID=A0A6P0U9L4_9FLAO|nr:DoxX family protein [Muriicola jejuensis]NER09925.1 DoxX family protein [Muriicola jejuensis]SMP04725.1 hypothetical protein SAMN06265375_101551 [Muriicola jejuensis]
MKGFTENLPQLLLLLFVVITFLQSGLDKVWDWKGNLSWLREHFSKTPLRNLVPLLLLVITIMELLAGIASLVGGIQLIVSGSNEVARAGAVLAAISLLMLLLGQRVAKDYDGAKTIVIYFIPTVILVLLLQY